MYRYFAIMWSSGNQDVGERVERLTRRIEERVPGARCCLNEKGLSVYYATDSLATFECYRTADEPVVVLGKLYERDFSQGKQPSSVAFNRRVSREILTTRGRVLVKDYWGGYVAIVHDRLTGRSFVLRDPTADVPCFMTTMDGFTVFFSCMEDCLALGLRKFSVNWSYAARFLLRPHVDVCETGLNEVSVLGAGEAIEIENGETGNRVCHWDLVKTAAESPIDDIDEAVRLARATLLGCTSALASQHPQVILRLSGGLDSSIVLAGLMHSPSTPEVTCIHHYDHYAGADERHFARLAVEGARKSSGRQCELQEYKRIPGRLDLPSLLTLPRTACPANYTGYLSERYIGPMHTSNGRSVQFTGSGGDPAFFRFTDNAAAIDYAWRHGIDMKFLRVAFETAQSGDSIYGVIRDAVRDGLLKRKRRYDLFKKWNMLDDRLSASVRRDEDVHLSPPWFRMASGFSHGLSPEKMRQLQLMTAQWKRIDPFERVGDSEWIAPIGAQPVTELFARIPLHILMAGAQDRTIPRRAFQGLLPQELLSRRTKSFLDEFSLGVVRCHEHFLREIFLDGILVRERILDRTKLEGMLAKVQFDDDPGIARLLGPQLNLEAWLRNWSRHESLATASAA